MSGKSTLISPSPLCAFLDYAESQFLLSRNETRILYGKSQFFPHQRDVLDLMESMNIGAFSLIPLQA
ncbi:MAG: hypothetical protein CFE49_17920 [Pseudomonas sp. PGPPP3]|nr:MAG: hypothetical protein CFE49_17920 [Pseudomonas sp. PGPPP3]